MTRLVGLEAPRSGWRRLTRRPGRTLIAAATLALGIGSLMAAFAAVDQVILRDLPVRQQDKLVVAWFRNPARDSVHIPFRSETFEALRRGTHSLEAVAAVETVGSRPTTLVGPNGPFVLRHARVAGDFFGVLGTEAARGRLLRATDDLQGAEPVLVLSHRAWVGRFGADPRVIGSSVRYAGRPFTVVGVAAEGFEVPQGTDVWATLRGAYPGWADEEPVGIELDLVGRMAPGVDPATVAADLAATLRTDPTTSPVYASLDPVVVPLRERVIGPLEPVLGLIMLGAGVLLLASLVNTALLLISGGATAVQEVAIRRALGAGDFRVLGSLLANSVWAATLGLMGGIAFAWLALRVLVPLAPAELPRLDEVALDGRATLAAVLITVLGVTLAAAIAGWVSTRSDLSSVLRAKRLSGGGPGVWIQRGVAGLQIALTVLAAVGAGLLSRSVVALDSVDLGFDSAGLTVVTLTTPYTYFQVPDAYLAALQEVADDLEGRAGIEAVMPTLAEPLSRGLQLVMQAEGEPSDDLEDNPYFAANAVLPDHTDALGIRLLEGRTLEPGDNTPDADPVVVIDELMARTLWPGRSALGRRVAGFADPGTWWTVVGVVESTRYHDYLAPVPAGYFPARRLGTAPPTRLLVRTAHGGPSTVRELVERSFATVDPSVRVLAEDNVTDLLRRPMSRHRLAAGILLAFAGATLLLALVGVYGVFSVWVQARTREFGLRKALGARSADILRLVLVGSLQVGVVGAAAGLALAVWASSLAEDLLYGVSQNDPSTLVGVVLLALVTAVLAGLAPALRASGANPASTLSAD